MSKSQNILINRRPVVLDTVVSHCDLYFNNPESKSSSLMCTRNNVDEIEKFVQDMNKLSMKIGSSGYPVYHCQNSLTVKHLPHYFYIVHYKQIYRCV